jgi:hypothetical protein
MRCGFYALHVTTIKILRSVYLQSFHREACAFSHIFFRALAICSLNLRDDLNFLNTKQQRIFLPSLKSHQLFIHKFSTAAFSLANFNFEKFKFSPLA